MTKNATFWTFDHETMRVLAQLRDDMGAMCHSAIIRLSCRAVDLKGQNLWRDIS